MTTPAGKEWQHPIRRIRSWREARLETKIAQEETQFELFHGYRMAVQVCPRGCGFHEQARRDLLVHTGRWGRAEVTASTGFETTHCPNDGAKLVRQCARCERAIVAPVVDRCQFCGVPQPWAAERRAGAERASLRLWRPEPEGLAESERRVHDPALLLYRSEIAAEGGKTNVMGDIWVIDGDIVRLAVDAVLSNDDIDGQMWSQSARAIKNAAGEGVERLAQEGKPFPLGHAWMTTAGELQQMKNIIHVASMSRYGKSTTGTVRKCLAATLRLATKSKFESIGLTAFGTGHAAIKWDEWVEVFAETTVSFLSGPAKQDDRTVPLAVVLVLFEPRKFEEEVVNLRRAVHDAWVKFSEPADGKPEPPMAGIALVEDS